MNKATPFRAKKHAALAVMRGALEELSLAEAVEVTGLLLAGLAASSPRPAKRQRIQSSASVFQQRQAGRKHSIEGDAELEAFILSLKGQRTIETIRQECVERFGAKRAPSKSALHRYIQKLQYRNKGNENVGE